jgi:lactate permease
MGKGIKKKTSKKSVIRKSNNFKRISILGAIIFILVSLFIGMFGAFIVGSNTVSNILFGQLQLETAKSLLLPISVILSLQVVGGAIGNMIAIHNVLAASASVNLHHQEGAIIRKTLPIAIIYAIIAIILGYLIIFVF